MKIALFSGFPGIAGFTRLSCGSLVALALLSCAAPARAADNAKAESAPPHAVNPVTVSPGTGAFQGLIPPAGSAVVNPPHAADKSTAPAPTPTATVHYGAAKPDSEDTNPPLNMAADRAELVRLDTDAASVIVGNPETLNIQMENRKLLVLTPVNAGATYLSILDDAGNVIMQRHVIVSSPKDNYIRIRRSCNGNAKNCQQTSVYYCPGMCHAVGGAATGTATAPSASGGESVTPQNGTGASDGETPPAPPTAGTTGAPPVNPVY